MVTPGPLPKSASNKKRAIMCGQPRQQKLGTNNLSKTLEDAFRTDDERIWDVRTRKSWAHHGLIEIVNFSDEVAATPITTPRTRELPRRSTRRCSA